MRDQTKDNSEIEVSLKCQILVGIITKTLVRCSHDAFKYQSDITPRGKDLLWRGKLFKTLQEDGKLTKVSKVHALHTI